jgi:large subunit ribosomal protein L29
LSALEACYTAGSNRVKNPNLHNKLGLILGVSIKKKEIRSLAEDALKTTLGQLQLELNTERRKIVSTGTASKSGKTRSIKRTIARINTILKERGATI